MLGWLRHKTPPVPGPAERGDPQHSAEARLERLLDRLGNESHATASVAEVREIILRPTKPPVSETAPETPPATASRPEYVEGVDPSDYREGLPVLRRVAAAVGGKPEDDSGMLAAKMVGALRDRNGFTPDLLSDIGPYLEQFVRDVHDGLVQLDADNRAAIGGGPEADSEASTVAAGESAPSPPSATIAPPEAATEAAAEIAPPPTGEIIALNQPDAEEAREIAPPARARRRAQKGHSGEAETVGEATAGSREMRVIAVCSQKGGAGKTTIAAHLAVHAGETGHGPAVLIDTDPQGSLGEWWRARHADSPALATVKLEDLAASLAELRSYGTALAIIDTPPALTGSIEQVIALADLVVIPARPSPHDLRAVGATVEMACRAGKPFLFVVNGAAPRASITAQAVAALSEHGRVAPVILYQRTGYAASMIDGRTVTETAASGNSAQEIAALWQYVYEQITMRAAA